MRQKAMEAARRHKASWIELGQYLYVVHKERHFKSWGYLTFEAYCVKELGMKEAAAAKLLKSYFFLDREEPRLAAVPLNEEESPKAVPNYESVNLLRLAKENKKLTPQDFAEIRESVIGKAKEPKEVRAQVKKLIAAHAFGDAEEETRRKRNGAIKRLVSMLSNVKREFERGKLLPAYLLRQINDLAEKLRDQIEA